MTTLTVEVKFIMTSNDIGLSVHAATAVGYQYASLCGDMYPHDTAEHRFTDVDKLSQICSECLEAMANLGMPTEGCVFNKLGDIALEPQLMRAVQHLFEAERHITGYAKKCPVCGGTQVDGDEGCKMCLPLFEMILDAKVINGMANAILLVEDPFDV